MSFVVCGNNLVFMRLSVKEKAGTIDTSRIFEGLHLSERFIRNMADEKIKSELEPEITKEGEIHFGVCGKCRNQLEEFKKEFKEQGLPL